MMLLGNLPALLQGAVTGPDAASVDTQSTLRWLDAPAAWIIGLIILPVLVVVVFNRSEKSTRKWLLRERAWSHSGRWWPVQPRSRS